MEAAMSAQLDGISAPRIVPHAAPLAIAHARSRLASIDILRGLVIVLMALDHVRDYFSGARMNPLDLTQTTELLFLTRWVTHFCAPIFIFLAGVSAYLISLRCTRAQLSRFLLTRGLWLVALELTVVNIAWAFNVRYQYGLFLQVIWAIGFSMMLLAALVHLPLRVIAAISLVMIAGHNLLDGVSPASFGAWAPLWSVLHVFGPVPFGFVAYPLIPWVAVMSLGYVAGTLFQLEPQRRQQWLLRLGVAALVVFTVLRFVNLYGDPDPWSAQSTALRTLLAFVNVHKYPPSLSYLLLTLGTACLLLLAFESAQGRVVQILRTFGRVPLFFYVLHIVLAHLSAGVIAMASGFGAAVLTNAFMFKPQGWGFGLPIVYLAWALVLAALYPACRWFAALKQRRSEWWLSYL
jgi:uncharacterized membrane protein